MAHVAAVNISEKKGTVKKTVETAELVENFGLRGDAHGGSWHRQVSLLACESVARAKEQAKDPEKWLRSLVLAAKQVEHGLDKTMFKVQTVDWRTGRCIPTATVKHWLRVLVQAGAKHVAYYPDNLFDDCPKLTEIREAVSTEAFPFIPERRAR